MLLYLENGKMTSRRIGMIISSLSIQGIDIVMQRYLTCEDRLVIGIAPEDADQSIGIIREIVDGGYHT